MGDRVPHRTLEIGQKASVEILGPPTQPVDAAVVVTETHQIRVADAREPRQETVEARERFVAVARDRPPHVAFRCVEARPPPLIGMAIAVTEQEVEQARREERAGIHPLTRAAPSQVQQAVRARDLARFCEPARTARSLARAGPPRARPSAAGRRGKAPGPTTPPRAGVTRRRGRGGRKNTWGGPRARSAGRGGPGPVGGGGGAPPPPGPGVPPGGSPPAAT